MNFTYTLYSLLINLTFLYTIHSTLSYIYTSINYSLLFPILREYSYHPHNKKSALHYKLQLYIKIYFSSSLHSSSLTPISLSPLPTPPTSLVYCIVSCVKAGADDPLCIVLFFVPLLKKFFKHGLKVYFEFICFLI